MKASLLVFVATFISFSAGAEKESGGDPETVFDYDRSAIMTILEDGEVVSHLRSKGKILSITPVKGEGSVFAVETDRCTLHVEFVRSCDFPPDELPQCEYSANVLLDQSSGDCGA